MDMLSELAFDPRPTTSIIRSTSGPNYHFGRGIRPDRLQGNYRRFVIQQVTLDALMARTFQERDLPQRELVYEAAAVLAGTILMAAVSPEADRRPIRRPRLWPIFDESDRRVPRQFLYASC